MLSGTSLELAWLGASELVESAVLRRLTGFRTASTGFLALPAGFGLGAEVDVREERELAVET